MIKKITFLTALLCLTTFTAFTQEESDDSSLFKKKTSRFKESSDYKMYTNVIKTDLYSIICGDLPLIFGHKFSPRFDLEGGPGILLPYYVDPFSFLTDEGFTNDKLGFSFLVTAKYLANGDNNSIYYSLFARYKNYSLSDFFEIGFNYGFQFLIKERFILNTGAFISNTMSMNNSTKYEKGLGFGLTLQFGYVLK